MILRGGGGKLLLFSIEGYGKLLDFYDGFIIFCFNFVDIGAAGFV